MPWAAKLYKELWQKLGPQSKWLTQELHVVAPFWHIVEPFWVGKGPKQKNSGGRQQGMVAWKWHQVLAWKWQQVLAWKWQQVPAWTKALLPTSWVNLDKSTGSSKSHFERKWKVSVTQSCLTLCNPMNCSPLGSSVYGILQSRILEWVAISSFRGSSGPRDWNCISWGSCIADRFFTIWATRKGAVSLSSSVKGRWELPYHSGEIKMRLACIMIAQSRVTVMNT